MVAKDLCSGQEWRIWRGDFAPAPPFPIDDDALFVAYYASAELGCFKALGWSMPKYVLDLFSEFRNMTNCTNREPVTVAGNGLIGALSQFGLDTIGAGEKKEMRELILRDGPELEARRPEALDYCGGDTYALERLLPAMLPYINLPHALLRGRYMKANATMEWAGVPIDVETLGLLREHWEGIQGELIAEIDRDYGVYDGRTFKRDAFRGYLARHGIPWPQDENGVPDLDKETFRQMAKSYPIIAPLRELRHALSDLRLNALQVGDDGRARTVLWAYASRTGRNQPSSSKYIFGPSVWLRSLIKPPPGHGIVYCDWSQQEFAIAAALSGDPAMMAAYLTGDPYLEFAKQAGAVPADATKKSHGPIRELYKQCALAVLYGMSAYGLAAKLGVPIIVARDLIEAHKRTFRKFWSWSEAVMNHV